MTDITRGVLEGRWRWQRVTMRPASSYKDGDEEQEKRVGLEGREEDWWGKRQCGVDSKKDRAVWEGSVKVKGEIVGGIMETWVLGWGRGRVQSLYITTRMSRDFIFLQVHVFSQYIRLFALYTISALYHDDFTNPVVVEINGICFSYLIQII